MGEGRGGWALIIEKIIIFKKERNYREGKGGEKKSNAASVSSPRARGNERRELAACARSAAGRALVCNSRRGAKAASTRAPAAARRAVAAGGEEKMGHCPSDQSI